MKPLAVLSCVVLAIAALGCSGGVADDPASGGDPASSEAEGVSTGWHNFTLTKRFGYDYFFGGAALEKGQTVTFRVEISSGTNQLGTWFLSISDDQWTPVAAFRAPATHRDLTFHFTPKETGYYVFYFNEGKTDPRPLPSVTGRYEAPSGRFGRGQQCTKNDQCAGSLRCDGPGSVRFCS
jgi:hypothetical protein